MRCHPNILPTYACLVAYELPFGVNKTFKVLKDYFATRSEKIRKANKINNLRIN